MTEVVAVGNAPIQTIELMVDGELVLAELESLYSCALSVKLDYAKNGWRTTSSWLSKGEQS